MVSDSQPQDLPSGVLQDKEPVEQPERNGWDHEQVDRYDAVGMIVKESFSSLRRQPPSLRHVLRDCGLPDLDAKLEKLTMNPRCTP
jgi:hypothetical protein